MTISNFKKVNQQSSSDWFNKLKHYRRDLRGTESMKKNETSATSQLCDRCAQCMVMLGSFIKRIALLGTALSNARVVRAAVT